MLTEWMFDIPPNLNRDWYVIASPVSKHCFVVSSNGSTVSKLHNGSIQHHFPSFLPNGARTKEYQLHHIFIVLDCIFHELDQTCYVIDMVYWQGYSLYDCSAEFRFFWLNSKLSEIGVCNPPSAFHKHRFSFVPIYDCNQIGLHATYTGSATFVKDGLLFYNRHAHYQIGNTPLALQVVLELQDDGKFTIYDDPPIVFGCLEREFLQN